MIDRILSLSGILALSLSLSQAYAAEEAPAPKPAVELGTPFGDNAILQRGMEVPVWGWAKSGDEVTVTFAGQTKKAKAGKDGKWMLNLDSLEASFEPREMTITESSGDSRTLKNILVGEVWMASGQSNMQWPVGKTTSALLEVTEKADVMPIRECKITDVFATHQPIEHATGVWNVDEGYKDYSAIAFAFAHKLYGELGVPIGILNCSFSQTAIEAWTPREGFAGGEDEYAKSVYQRILEADPTTPEHKKAWEAFYTNIEDTLTKNEALIKEGKEPIEMPIKDLPGNMQGNRDATWLFNARTNPMIPYAIRGAIWNQGYANIGGGSKYYSNLHSMTRGWRLKWGRPDLPIYFHQFYTPGTKDTHPNIGQASDMRFATWKARDIANSGMASQIDVEGAIHYRHKAVPGQRLALHALKNQYDKDVVADGPMFKSYEVKGNQLIVHFENADDGLVVAETGSNALAKGDKPGTGFADPKVIPNGDDKVELFYLAGEDRVWHPAKLKIDGNKAILTASGVSAPKGVSYASGGVGFRPNLYNKALLPATPFIFYDNKMVTAESWPDDPLKIAGVTLDPSEGGKLYEYRKMPLLSTYFRDDAVLQAGVPITIWGSAVHDWGYEADGEAVIEFDFNGTKETIPVTPGMKEWQVTVPAMEASAEPKTLTVKFFIDGELVHERVSKNIVVGDVYYIGGSMVQGQGEAADGMVRVMTRRAKRDTFKSPSRYSVAVSTTPKNRFASEWKNPDGGLVAEIGKIIHEKTGNPVGFVFMSGPALEMKHWIGFEHLKDAPSLMDDYKDLAAVKPGNEFYRANVQRYIDAWKTYWSEYIPQMIATKAVPDGKPWGSYPSLGSTVETEASQSHNMMVYPFSMCSFKGIGFIAGEATVAKDQGASFGPELEALAASWRDTFAGEPAFFYTMPDASLAPKLTKPSKIGGSSVPLELKSWFISTDEKGRATKPSPDQIKAAAEKWAAKLLAN